MVHYEPKFNAKPKKEIRLFFFKYNGLRILLLELAFVVEKIEHRMKRFFPAKTLKLLAELQTDLKNLSPKDWTEFEKQPPRTMSFETTDTCNANCTFCASRYFKPEGIMSMQTYEKALEQYISIGGKSAWFNAITGEPLLDPFLFERIEIASSHSKIKTYLYTNGILLAKSNNARSLINAGISEIHVSIAAFDKDKYVRTMGVNKYEDVLLGIQELLKINNEMGRRVVIYLELRESDYRSLVTPDFTNYILPLINESFIQKNIRFLTLFDSWGGMIKEIDLPAGKTFLPIRSRRYRPCRRTFNVAILPNGDVRVCDCRVGKKGKHDELVIGDINKNSLNELWSGPRVKEIRRGFKSGKNDVCNNCEAYSPI